MPLRTRVVRPGFFTHSILGGLPATARILFEGLWCMADREGYLVDRPEQIKTEILPYDEVDVDLLLWMLCAAGFIQRYQVNGVKYIAVPTLHKHQSTGQFEAPSQIPDISEGTLYFPEQSSLAFSLFNNLDQLAGSPYSPTPSGIAGSPYTENQANGQAKTPPARGRAAATLPAMRTAVPAAVPAAVKVVEKSVDNFGWEEKEKESIKEKERELKTNSQPAGRPAREEAASPTPNGNGNTAPSINLADWPAAVRAIRAVPVWPGDAKVIEVIRSALNICPDLSDTELADATATVRKPGQKQAGLFLKTIPEWLAHRRNGKGPKVGGFLTCGKCGGARRLTGDLLCSSRDIREAERLGWEVCQCIGAYAAAAGAGGNA